MGAFDDLVPATQSGGEFDDLVPSAQPAQQDLASKVRQDMADKPWYDPTNIAKGAGASLYKAGAGLGQLVGVDVDPEKLKAAEAAMQESKVGATIGEIIKFLPAAKAASILGGAAAAAGIGAATTPGDAAERAKAGALEGGMSAAAGGLVKGVTNLAGMGSLDRARQALQDIIGSSNMAKARQLISGAPANVTTNQALHELDNPTLASLDKMIRGVGSSGDEAARSAQAFSDIAKQQEAQRIAELERLARATSEESSNAMQSVARKKLESGLGPVRQGELVTANVRGVDVNNILNNIQSTLTSPKTGVSDDVQRVLGDVVGKIKEWAPNGVIDADALYSIRKSYINEAVDKLLAGRDPTSSKKLTAQLTSQIRPLIDDAIENAGGKEWKKYIKSYHAGLEGIDRLDVLDKARQLYGKSPEAFMDLVKGESPEIVQKIMSGKAGIGDLPPSTLKKLQNISGQLERDIKLGKLASDSAGKSALDEILKSDSILTHLPNLLNRYVVIANTAIKSGEMKVNRNMYKHLEKAMRDPKEMSKLLDMLPPEQRSKMIGLIVDAQKAGVPQVAGAAAGGVMEAQ